MVKYILAFLAFAALTVWLLNRSTADIDMSGEKHDTGATHSVEKPEPKKP